MKPNFISWISVWTLLLVVTSCEDHRIPQAQRFRIKTVRTTSTDPYTTYISTTTERYNYNSNGRLVSYVSGLESNSPAPIGDSSRTVLNYDAQGRLETIFSESWDLVNTASGVVRLWRPDFNNTYAYDLNGNISVMRIVAITKDRSRSPNLLEVLRFEYNGAKFPVKVLHTRASDNNQWVDQYTYSGANIVKVEQSDNHAAPVTTVYQYDNKPNPFYGLIIGTKRNDSFTAFNSNNLIVSGYQYEYDSNGLLLKIVTVDGVVQTYEYETY
ncbi:hypothetical protein GCM10028818_47820 [Spirosoma horti]